MQYIVQPYSIQSIVIVVDAALLIPRVVATHLSKESVQLII